jgi:hypothetical protein
MLLLQRGGMARQTREPLHLVSEFRPRLRIAIRHVEGRDNQAADSGFDVARLIIIWIARQFAAGDDGLGVTRENSNAIPASFALPYGAVARAPQRRFRKSGGLALQLLKANDIRLGLLQPREKMWQTRVDVVDVERRDLHSGSVRRSGLHSTSLNNWIMSAVATAEQSRRSSAIASMIFMCSPKMYSPE